MMGSRRIIFLGSLLFFPLFALETVQGKSGGKTSFDFLTLPQGPRQMAMGGSGVAIADNLDASALNPAALGHLWRGEVSALYSDWLSDSSFHYAGVGIPTRGLGAVAFAFHGLDYGEIDGFTAQGLKTSDIEARDQLGRLSYGLPFRDRLWGGISAKYIRGKLHTENASAWAFDLGMQWQGPHRGWLRSSRLGASIRNMGSKPKFDQKSFDLPRTAQLGLGIQPFFKGLTVTADYVNTNHIGGSARYGIEYLAKDVVTFRSGYDSAYDIGRGISLGMGVRVWDVEINYAYAGFSDLGQTHHVGLTLKFGNLAERHYEKGMVFLRQKDFPRAIMEFSKVLKWDHTHRRALLRLKEANTHLQKEINHLNP